LLFTGPGRAFAVRDADGGPISAALVSWKVEAGLRPAGVGWGEPLARIIHEKFHRIKYLYGFKQVKCQLKGP